MAAFRKALLRTQQLVALVGPSGAGKTFWALSLATQAGGPVALISLEGGQGARSFPQVDLAEVVGLEGVLEALREAYKARYPVVVVDCLSSFYRGPNGLMTLVDRHGDSGWSLMDDKLVELWRAFSKYPGHILCTLRAEEVRLVVEREGEQRMVSRCGKVDFKKDYGQRFDVILEMSEGVADCKKGPVGVYGKLWPQPGAELAALLLPPISGSQVSQPAPEVIPPQEAAPETTPHPSETGTSTPVSTPKTDGVKPEEQWTIKRLRMLAASVAQVGVKPEAIREVFSRHNGEFDEKNRLKAMPEARYEMAAGELEALGMDAQAAAETPWDSGRNP